jgi:hypothetical protein
LRIGGARWRRRNRRHVRLGGRSLSARGRTKLPQPLFELPVPVLQLLVLAGQLPKLALQPLDPHFHIGIIGLRES